MNKIIILDENTSNQIAAGEVIERPASVVKELIENSIDAGASSITIEISRGGIALIKITDNGSGIPQEDVEMAFERHGTSKIQNAVDLSEISTMGFRGEALPSIASVAKVDLNTRTENSSNGVRIKISGGNIEGKQKSSRDRGTTVAVRNLFFNTPARYKFLKNDTTEARYCTDIVSRLALAYPNISFRYFSNGIEILRTPGDNILKNAVFCVYGREISANLYKVDYNDGTYSITGFTGNRSTARGNRQNQTVFINGRSVKSREITAAVEKAYETEIMKGKFPFFVLNIDIEPSLVDVNVHPAKSEVRFAKSNEVFSSVYNALKGALDVNRGVVAGGIGNAKIKRGISYITEPDLNEKNTFFNDGGKREKNNSAKARELHESMKQTKELFYSKDSEAPAINESKANGSVENEEDINILLGGTFSGVLFNTFILLNLNKDVILLIDQHAAHERITYENLLNRFKRMELSSQVLLVPWQIRLTAAESMYAEENRDFLVKLGFDFDFLGRTDIVIRGIPSELMEKNTEDAFKGALDSFESNRGKEVMLIEKEAIYSMACKNSVKANEILSETEINVLIERLRTLENPYTCPHGRPVVLKLARRELEKLFKRII